jgi:hypothetical protein
MRIRSSIAGDRGGKTVPLTDDRFYKPGRLRIVAQDETDFANGDVNAVIDIQEDVLAPEAFGYFVAGDQISASFHQQDEQLHGELFKPQLVGAALQPITRAVKREVAEMEFLGRKTPQLPEVFEIMPHGEATRNNSGLRLYRIFIHSLPVLNCRFAGAGP